MTEEINFNLDVAQEAMTEVIDLLIFVKSIKDITTDETSVKKKFFNKKFLITCGKCVKDNTKLIQVNKPNIIPKVR